MSWEESWISRIATGDVRIRPYGRKLLFQTGVSRTKYRLAKLEREALGRMNFSLLLMAL